MRLLLAISAVLLSGCLSEQQRIAHSNAGEAVVALEKRVGPQPEITFLKSYFHVTRTAALPTVTAEAWERDTAVAYAQAISQLNLAREEIEANNKFFFVMKLIMGLTGTAGFAGVVTLAQRLRVLSGALRQSVSYGNSVSDVLARMSPGILDALKDKAKIDTLAAGPAVANTLTKTIRKARKDKPAAIDALSELSIPPSVLRTHEELGRDATFVPSSSKPGT